MSDTIPSGTSSSDSNPSGSSKPRDEKSRDTAILRIRFPEDLPISGEIQRIAKSIEGNQVVILAGETGSGKTTQLPKICLQVGRGHKALIGHTQPRRIAARTVASRIAEELNVELGQEVGYQVRFTDHSSASTRIKLMTDGVLLAEIRHDPLLRKYDTLIIDEAHERSLNIDFLLGYLTRILPQRPDLKVIVTSATIDLQRFSAHFNHAPILEVSGRTWPVKVVYRPWQYEFEDMTEAIVETARDLLTQGEHREGDILVFLSGEREIRLASQALRKSDLQHVEILPLYARLSIAEQNRVFQKHRGRRIVLTTNVAETSLTVPGIRYVIDPGTARINRYSLRSKVQRLPIESISQASANQRKGRCGRVSAGVCVRLYEESDFNSRPLFTEAEILRTSLAGVVLQMLNLGIGDVRNFPFVEAPDIKQLNDGFRLLEELQAVDKQHRITSIGKTLSGFQVDPRMARILLEANKFNCLREMLVIVSGLSIQDVRERPAEKKQQADEKHRRFWHEQSDFMAFLKLWDYLEEQRQNVSQNQLRKLCRKEFINYLRFREWRDVHYQLGLAIKRLGWKISRQDAGYEQIHRALLSGLLTNIGQKSEEEKEKSFLGTRNQSFLIFPGSSQSKKKPRWLLAAEMLETSQLFAHCVAKIEPDWIIESAQHLCKEHYFEPHYNRRQGQVLAYARISLYGLVLVEKKRVSYGKIDPKRSREIFIRAALVEGAYRGKGDFFQHLKKLVDEVLSLEARSRKRDIMVDDEILYQFFEERVPEGIVNLSGFESWRKQAERKNPRLLFLSKNELMLHAAETVSEAQFPREMVVNGVCYPLEYSFDPGHLEDGVSIRVSLSQLHQLNAARLDWLVPGMLKEKIVYLLKSLPKNIRRKLVPIPQRVDSLMETVKACNKTLPDVLAHQLGHALGSPASSFVFDESQLENYYRFNIKVCDDDGNVITQGRCLKTLRAQYKEKIQRDLQSNDEGFQVQKLKDWDFDELQSKVYLQRAEARILAYPALVDKYEWVDLLLMDDPAEAHVSSVRGCVRLAYLKLRKNVLSVQKDLLQGNDAGLVFLNIGGRKDILDDLMMAALANAYDFKRVRNKSGFEQALTAVRGELFQQANQLDNILTEIVKGVLEIRKTIKTSKNALALALSVADINSQLEGLIYKGFLFCTPQQWLLQFPRYLQAVLMRLEKAPRNLDQDKKQMQLLTGHIEKHRTKYEQDGLAAWVENPEWQLYRWMIEELRVSFFAQQLKTAMPVSEKRLEKQWARVLEYEAPSLEVNVNE